jgi:hypothetical protein
MRNISVKGEKSRLQDLAQGSSLANRRREKGGERAVRPAKRAPPAKKDAHAIKRMPLYVGFVRCNWLANASRCS